MHKTDVTIIGAGLTGLPCLFPAGEGIDRGGGRKTKQGRWCNANA